jgi:hypothetical protein
MQRRRRRDALRRVRALAVECRGRCNPSPDPIEVAQRAGHDTSFGLATASDACPMCTAIPPMSSPRDLALAGATRRAPEASAAFASRAIAQRIIAEGRQYRQENRARGVTSRPRKRAELCGRFASSSGRQSRRLLLRRPRRVHTGGEEHGRQNPSGRPAACAREELGSPEGRSPVQRGEEVAPRELDVLSRPVCDLVYLPKLAGRTGRARCADDGVGTRIRKHRCKSNLEPAARTHFLVVRARRQALFSGAHAVRSPGSMACRLTGEFPGSPRERESSETLLRSQPIVADRRKPQATARSCGYVPHNMPPSRSAPSPRRRFVTTRCRAPVMLSAHCSCVGTRLRDGIDAPCPVGQKDEPPERCHRPDSTLEGTVAPGRPHVNSEVGTNNVHE